MTAPPRPVLGYRPFFAATWPAVLFAGAIALLGLMAALGIGGDVAVGLIVVAALALAGLVMFFNGVLAAKLRKVDPRPIQLSAGVRLVANAVALLAAVAAAFGGFWFLYWLATLQGDSITTILWLIAIAPFVIAAASGYAFGVVIWPFYRRFARFGSTPGVAPGPVP